MSDEVVRSHIDRDEYLSIADRLPAVLKRPFWVALCDAIQDEVSRYYERSGEIRYVYSIKNAPDIERLINILVNIYGRDSRAYRNLIYSLYTRYALYGLGGGRKIRLMITRNRLLSDMTTLNTDYSTTDIVKSGSVLDEKSSTDSFDSFSPVDMSLYSVVSNSNVFSMSAVPVGRPIPGSFRIILYTKGSSGEQEETVVAEDDRSGGFIGCSLTCRLLEKESYIVYDTLEMKVSFVESLDTSSYLILEYSTVDSQIAKQSPTLDDILNLGSESSLFRFLQKEVEKESFFNLYRGSREFYQSVFTFFSFSFESRIFNTVVSSNTSIQETELGLVYSIRRSAVPLLSVDSNLVNGVPTTESGVMTQEPDSVDGTTEVVRYRLDIESPTVPTLDSDNSTTVGSFLDVNEEVSSSRITRYLCIEAVVRSCYSAPVTLDEYYNKTGRYMLQGTGTLEGHTLVDRELNGRTLVPTEILGYMYTTLSEYKRSTDLIDLGFQITHIIDESGFYDTAGNTDRISSVSYTDSRLRIRSEFSTSKSTKTLFNSYENVQSTYHDPDKRLHMVFGTGSLPMRSRSTDPTQLVSFPTDCALPLCDIDIQPSEIDVNDNYLSLVACYRSRTLKGVEYVSTDNGVTWNISDRYRAVSGLLPVCEKTMVLYLTILSDNGISTTGVRLVDNGDGILYSSDRRIAGRLTYMTGRVEILEIASGTVTGMHVVRGYGYRPAYLTESMLYMGSTPVVYSVYPMTEFSSGYLHMNYGMIIKKSSF